MQHRIIGITMVPIEFLRPSGEPHVGLDRHIRFMSFGFLGLFFGAVVLVIACDLLISWLEEARLVEAWYLILAITAEIFCLCRYRFAP